MDHVCNSHLQKGVVSNCVDTVYSNCTAFFARMKWPISCLKLVIRGTGYAKAARSLNMVHQSAVGLSCLSWYCLWILVKADKLMSPLVPIVSGHEPPTVLRGPSYSY